MERRPRIWDRLVIFAKNKLYTARPPQVIVDLLFSQPAALRSLTDTPASSTFRALQAEKKRHQIFTFCDRAVYTAEESWFYSDAVAQR